MEPQLEPLQVKSSNMVLVVVSSVLIAASIAGGSVYAYQKNQNDKQQANLQNQIDSLNTRLAAQTPIPTVTPMAMPTPTALGQPTTTPTPITLQTYTSPAYHFAFTYPEAWSVDGANAKLAGPYDCKSADGLCLLLTDNHPAPHGPDQHYLVKIRVSKPVKPLAVDSYSAQTLKTYLDTYYRNVAAVQLGGLSGYSAQPTSQNEENGQSNAVIYFIPQSDNSIVSLWEWRKLDDTESIIQSVKFNQ